MRKRIVVIGSRQFPIPAVKGGAISSLVTALINENEKVGKYDFLVFCGRDSRINNYCYQYTTIVQIPTRSPLLQFFCYATHVFNKLFSISKPINTPYMVWVNRKMKKEQCDLILFETTYDDALRLKRKENCPTIFHIHSDYISEKIGYLNILSSIYDYYFVISDFLRYKLLNIGFLRDGSRVKVLRNGTELNSPTKDNLCEKRVSLREKHGLNISDFVLVYVGRLSQEKGCLELIKAYKKSGVTAKLLIIGGENFSSNKQTAYVSKLYEEAHGYEDKIIFTGYMAHNEALELIRACDVGVVPSVCNEACSLALLEFRAASLPSIAFNVGAISEFCNKESTILVDFDQNAVDNMSNAIREIVEDNMYGRLKKCAKENLSYFSYPSYFDRFSDLVDQIVASSQDK